MAELIRLAGPPIMNPGEKQTRHLWILANLKSSRLACISDFPGSRCKGNKEAALEAKWKPILKIYPLGPR